ncbi:hypothetical protein JOQ06_009307, partial [Pogonophryne albipinna]
IRGADCVSEVWVVLAGLWGRQLGCCPVRGGTGWQPGGKALLRIHCWESD